MVETFEIKKREKNVQVDLHRESRTYMSGRGRISARRWTMNPDRCEGKALTFWWTQHCCTWIDTHSVDFRANRIDASSTKPLLLVVNGDQIVLFRSINDWAVLRQGHRRNILKCDVSWTHQVRTRVHCLEKPGRTQIVVAEHHVDSAVRFDVADEYIQQVLTHTETVDAGRHFSRRRHSTCLRRRLILPCHLRLFSSWKRHALSNETQSRRYSTCQHVVSGELIEMKFSYPSLWSPRCFRRW